MMPYTQSAIYDTIISQCSAIPGLPILDGPRRYETYEELISAFVTGEQTQDGRDILRALVITPSVTRQAAVTRNGAYEISARQDDVEFDFDLYIGWDSGVAVFREIARFRDELFTVLHSAQTQQAFRLVKARLESVNVTAVADSSIAERLPAVICSGTVVCRTLP